jgi:hypothetical protein
MMKNEIAGASNAYLRCDHDHPVYRQIRQQTKERIAAVKGPRRYAGVGTPRAHGLTVGSARATSTGPASARSHLGSATAGKASAGKMVRAEGLAVKVMPSGLVSVMGPPNKRSRFRNTEHTPGSRVRNHQHKGLCSLRLRTSRRIRSTAIRLVRPSR